MVQSVANAYLLVIAGSSRVQALRAPVETDQAIYDRTANQKRAGTAASDRCLRARVAVTSDRKQQLIAQENQVAKDKLALGRVIGLPSGQQFVVADTEPLLTFDAITPETALARLMHSVQIFRAPTRPLSRGPRIPSGRLARAISDFSVSADYGVVGTALNNSHGTFTFQLQRDSTFSTAGESAATSFRRGRL